MDYTAEWVIVHVTKILDSLRYVAMVFILVLTPMSPLSETFIGEASQRCISAHTFSDGSVENIALYQGGADKTTLVAMPKGAEVLDVQVTLSGASSTGWSQEPPIHTTSGDGRYS